MHRCGERSRRAHKDRCRSVKKAATDVGGWNRFDIGQTRALGRAYLACFIGATAIARCGIRFNWGMGNLDTWICGGRTSEKLDWQAAGFR